MNFFKKHIKNPQKINYTRFHVKCYPYVQLEYVHMTSWWWSRGKVFNCSLNIFCLLHWSKWDLVFWKEECNRDDWSETDDFMMLIKQFVPAVSHTLVLMLNFYKSRCDLFCSSMRSQDWLPFYNTYIFIKWQECVSPHCFIISLRTW